MNPLVLWAIVCLAVALALLLVELFIPSGGLIGFCAAAALVAGIVLLFMVDTTTGLISGIIVLICVPFIVAFMLKVWPDTPMARWLTLRDALPARTPAGTVAAGDSAAVDARQPTVGATGHAVTDLRPVGVCVIAGQRLDCLAEAGIIRAGTPVRVSAVDGMQIKVQALEG